MLFLTPEAPGVLRMDEDMRPPAAVSAMEIDSLRSLRRVVMRLRISRISVGGKSVDADMLRMYVVAGWSWLVGMDCSRCLRVDGRVRLYESRRWCWIRLCRSSRLSNPLENVFFRIPFAIIGLLS